MNHYTAKSEIQKPNPPKISFHTLLVESMVMLVIAGVLVQIL